MANEPITGLPYQDANTLQTDVLQNAELNYVSAWLNCVVLSVGDTAPPGSPTEGDRYIVGASATGAWATHDDALAVYRGGWQFYAPSDGVAVKDLDSGDDYEFVSAAWTVKAGGGGSGDVVGPASSTNDHVALFDGTTGKLLKDGGALGTAATHDAGDFATAAQGALADSALQPNAPITGATKTKITYDADGLVTAGADATTADIADSTNKRYVTDAQLTVIGNTSGTNTGDQTSVTGNAGTATALQTARTIDGQSFDGTANITVIAPGTHAATSKATPVDADEIPLVDSAASNVLKKLTWANLKATVKTYFDTLYQAVLVSGTNIKTINGSSVLGSGDLTVSGSGDFVGPASATDNAAVRFDTTTGKLGQDSALIIGDVSGSSLPVSTTPGNAIAISATAPTQTTGAQAGVTASLAASAAVAGSSTVGAAAGGEVTVEGGAAARLTSGNADGGSVRLKPGAGVGTGFAGQVLLDDEGTESRPALAFDIGGNKAYGFWYSACVIGVSANGSRKAGFSSSGIQLYNGCIIAGDASNPGVFYGFKRQRFNLSSSTTLTSGSYNGSTITNSTASAAITSTLVSAAQGWNHTFIDDNTTYRWTIKPNTGDTIIWTDGTVVSATGSIVSTARYDAFDVEALDATVWLARNVRGTFTVTA